MNARQSDLARSFGRSQAWISKAQSRSSDPMPRELDAALAWGRRLGHLSAAPVAPDSLFSAPSVPASGVEAADMRLKTARADLLEIQRSEKTGDLVSLAEVEQREVAIAAEFRHAACEYPLRARAILERHIPDAVLVDRIVTDLTPLAAELLNKSDARQVLHGKSPLEIKTILYAWADILIEALTP